MGFDPISERQPVMEDRIYQIRITLNRTKPAIWRKVAVPADISLGELHEVIQVAMGWMDDHLHQFILRNKSVKLTREELVRAFQKGTPDPALFSRMRGERVFVPTTDPMGGPIDMDGEDEDDVTLAKVCPKVKSKILYEYDFGDGWEHTIEVQKITEPAEDVSYPLCLGGKLAGPPEDCGGVWGYYDLLNAIADPDHEMHEELSEWLGDEFDPEAFDLDEVNKIFAKWRRNG
jgi:hypothetical protein